MILKVLAVIAIIAILFAILAVLCPPHIDIGDFDCDDSFDKDDY